MAVKPENAFITGVHKHLPPPKLFHREKMNNPYRGGTADWWYSSKRDLWVEYKFIPTIPARGRVIPKLSALQLEWLTGRHGEGRNVKVIVGCPQGGCVIPRDAWQNGLSVDSFKTLLLTRRSLADYLLSETEYRDHDQIRRQRVQSAGGSLT